jgi:hypothetical protein
MESLEHALKRRAPILAEYLGGAVTCDAYHMTDPRVDGLGVSSCIEKSLQSAGVSPEEVMLLHIIILLLPKPLKPLNPKLVALGDQLQNTLAKTPPHTPTHPPTRIRVQERMMNLSLVFFSQ